MATIRNRNGRWHVQIRKANARPVSRTFTLRKDAEIWVRETERHIELEGCVVSKREMLADTLSVLINIRRALMVNPLIDFYTYEVSFSLNN